MPADIQQPPDDPLYTRTPMTIGGGWLGGGRGSHSDAVKELYISGGNHLKCFRPTERIYR